MSKLTDILAPEADPMGAAIRDYFHGKHKAAITVHSSVAEAEKLPASYLFRDHATMPEVERIALTHCRGRVLDVGAGAGGHSLYLHAQGLEVTAIDQSRLSVETMQARGVSDAITANIHLFDKGSYDTLLMLMNGTGIAGNLDGLKTLLPNLKSLLNPDGQILIDSCDIIYMYEEEDGSVWVDLNAGYYGEVNYTMEYGKVKSEQFDWLFIDAGLLQEYAEEAGFRFDVVYQGDNYEYLARLSV